MMVPQDERGEVSEPILLMTEALRGFLDLAERYDETGRSKGAIRQIEPPSRAGERTYDPEEVLRGRGMIPFKREEISR